MENDAAVNSLTLLWLLMKDLLPFSRRKDFKFLEGKDQIKWHCLYHFKIMTYPTILCQHKIWVFCENRGCFLSSKCISDKCIHAKNPMHFSFQSFPGQPIKLSQSKRPSGNKDFVHKQRWNSYKFQIPGILIVILKRNIAHCTPALSSMIWMLYLTHISSLSHTAVLST